jgi:hypothetical protein
MAFTLRITFSGLCLFVPEAVGDPGTGRMHVLMPSMGGHHHDPADRHIPVLSYDAGYLVQGAGTLGVTSVAKLTGYQLAFGTGDAASTALCSQIVNLKEVTGRDVDADHLGADSKKKLVSRVTLREGAITRVAPGVCWEWKPGEFRPVAHRVEWEIEDVPGDSLTITGQALRGGGPDRALGTLHAVDGRINLEILHETPQDLPPDPLPMEHQHPPMPGDSPKHFTAYYGLFGEPVPIVLPRYWGKLSECPPLPGGCPEIPPDMGGTAFTCLVGGAG